MPENSSTRKVEITLVGKRGKMGRALTQLIQQDPQLQLSADGDIVIDFSTPEGTLKAIQMGKPLVCGTTGLTEEHFRRMGTLAKRCPVLYSPNFSLGICLLFEIVEVFGERFKRFANISIKETHHRSKRDTPSGTALKLKDMLDAREVTAKREGHVVGMHEIGVCLGDEKLTLRHEAFNRIAFAKGAVEGAKYLLNRPPRLYQLSEILQETR